MNTSVLRYPKRDRFLRIHASLRVACKGNDCAAVLVPFFEYWHNFALDLEDYKNSRIDAENIIDASTSFIHSVLNDAVWQCHTDEDLKAGLMNHYKTDSINKALDVLEELRFISRDVPDRLKLLYKTGRRKWFLLMTDNINDWFESYEAQNKKLFFSPAVKKEKVSGAPDKRVKAKPFAVESRQVFRYWRAYTQNGDRLRQKVTPTDYTMKMIVDRLKENFTVEQLCQAVEGCLANPFNQGKNPDRIFYDSITTIFKSSEKVDLYLSYCERHNVADVEERVKQRLFDLDALESDSAPNSPMSDTVENSNRLADAIFYWVSKGSDSPAVIRIIKENGIPYSNSEINTAAVMKRLAELFEGEFGVFNNTYRTICNVTMQNLTQQGEGKK
jgi:hypothetical protein